MVIQIDTLKDACTHPRCTECGGCLELGTYCAWCNCGVNADPSSAYMAQIEAEDAAERRAARRRRKSE